MRFIRQALTVAWLMGLAAVPLVGCSWSMRTEAAARSHFYRYIRVAVWGQLDRRQDELFIPLYMQPFPAQELVERRDLLAVVGDQDVLPDRPDKATIQKIREALGVEAIIFPNYTPEPTRQMSLKVIDTETGEIVAAVLVTPRREDSDPTDRDMIRQAIKALKQKVS